MIDIFNKDHKIVGFVQNKVYFTDRRDEHFMIKYQGYGISEDILDKLVELGVEKVVIRTQSNEYAFAIEEYLGSHLTHTHEGTDLQKFVTLPGMSIKPYPAWNPPKKKKNKDVRDYFK